jgi:hypothetical protein
MKNQNWLNFAPTGNFLFSGTGLRPVENGLLFAWLAHRLEACATGFLMSKNPS